MYFIYSICHIFKRFNLFRTESLYKIKHVPLVYYKFKYDSISDRSQMGVLGLDAQR